MLRIAWNFDTQRSSLRLFVHQPNKIKYWDCPEGMTPSNALWLSCENRVWSQMKWLSLTNHFSTISHLEGWCKNKYLLCGKKPLGKWFWHNNTLLFTPRASQIGQYPFTKKSLHAVLLFRQQNVQRSTCIYFVWWCQLINKNSSQTLPETQRTQGIASKLELSLQQTRMPLALVKNLANM